MAIIVRFMSLSGPFRAIREETFQSDKAALDAVTIYAQTAGYSNVKAVEESGAFSIRYTAKTPGSMGISGRNVAFGRK